MRALPGDLLVDDEDGALAAAKARSYWMDGPRLDNGSVGAAVAYGGRRPAALETRGGEVKAGPSDRHIAP